ncbi:putative adipose-regulatory protein-domain-containing protein [Helicostylum pulchrum]|nr:putative adipose-regulatory protein-domain-containing protein [Helicostylum pulchrum]
MSRAFSDTDEYSDQGPDFHVVPSSSRYDPSEQDYEERRSSHDLLLEEDTSSLKTTEEEKETEEIPPIEWHPAVLVLANLIRKMFSPIFKIIFAPKTQRVLIKSLVVIIVTAWILMTSFTAYLTFYQRYIPKTAHVEPIYFQYTQVELPQGQVQFTGPNPDMPLRSDQAYDVSVQLHVPTSDINFNLGNFMVHVELLTQNGSILTQSSRPAILRYQSNTQRVLHVLAKAIPLLVGWTEESQNINVMLLENQIDKKTHPITHARVTLSSSKLQVYDAYISVVADFRGLRYYMYHRRISTAIVFMILFTVIEVVFASIAWKVFGENLWGKLNELFAAEEIAASEVDATIERSSQYNTDEEVEEDDDDDAYLTEE